MKVKFKKNRFKQCKVIKPSKRNNDGIDEHNTFFLIIDFSYNKFLYKNLHK